MAKFMFIDENGSGSEVLGVAEGRNEREALKNLVRKSPWLEEYDYDGISSVRLAEGGHDRPEVEAEDETDDVEGREWRPRLVTYGALLVVLVFLIWLFMSRLVSPAFTSGTTATQPVVKTVRFKNVQRDNLSRDVDIVLEKAKKKATVRMHEDLDAWNGELNKKAAGFVDWYCGYFVQQTLALKGAYGSIKGWAVGDTDAAAEIGNAVRAEFAGRVIQPEVAQQMINAIADTTVSEYFKSVTTGFDELSFKYQIPLQEWGNATRDITAMTVRTNTNRSVPLALKAITGLSAITTVRIAEKILPMIEKAGDMIFAKTITSLGRKALAGFAGEALGMTTVGALLVWDAYDHYQLQKTTRPMIQRSINEYLESLNGKVAAEITGIIDNAAIEIRASKVKLVSRF
ncbi:MAG TPA: hypothetical protein PKL57_12005 [Candidatus Wallbacteria bacterium]|nr:hypothetical protein [Candidatus Wallbacteria bacterium]